MSGDDTPAASLQAALAELERTLGTGTAPTPEAAVAALVPLGRLLLEGSLDGLDRTLSAVVELVDPAGPTWREAVAQGVIAKERAFAALLDEPTSTADELAAARTDLEALFCATDALGEPVPDELHERVVARDAALEERLSSRD